MEPPPWRANSEAELAQSAGCGANGSWLSPAWPRAPRTGRSPLCSPRADMFHSLPRVGSVRCTQCHRAHRDCVGVLEDNQLPMPARDQNVLLAPATKSGRIQPGPAHACACQSGIGESDRPRGSHLVTTHLRHTLGPIRVWYNCTRAQIATS